MGGWNGSGVFSKTYSWIADAANGIKILASRHDQNDNDFTSGINNCLTKDGQNAATSDLPMGGNKHTNVSVATARNQYLTMGQFQDNGGKSYTATGGANSYVLTPTPAISAYATGQSFRVAFGSANTGSSTINISSVGTANLVKGNNTALASGDIDAGRVYDIVYTASGFQIQPSGTMAWQDASSVAITGGSVTGITDLAIADGGTGASTASAAFSALKQAATTSATGVVELATAAEMVTGTDTGRVPSVSVVQNHSGVAKAWAVVNMTGTAAMLASYNVSGFADNGTGLFTLTWDTDFSSVNYALAGMASAASAGTDEGIVSLIPSSNLVGSAQFQAVDVQGNADNQDYAYNSVIAFGAQ